MSTQIKVNDSPFQFFKQVNVSKSLDEFSGHAQIVVSEPMDDLSIVKMNDLVTVVLDGFTVLKGYQESIEDSEDNDNHSISFKIRDVVQDLIDSTVPLNLRRPTSYTDFTQILQKAISGLGLKIGIINQRGALPITGKDTNGMSILHAAEVGQITGDYLNECARLAAVIMNCDGNGNILLRNFTNKNKLKTMLLNEPGALNNNVLSSSLEIDYTQRFGTIKIRSHGNVEYGSDGVASGLADFRGTAFDKEARSARVLELLSKTPLTSYKLCATRAQEEVNLRRTRSFKYNCEVQGFSANGELWDIGQLVRVSDPKRRVTGWLLIKEVEYSLTDAGEKTKMVLTYPDAYGVTLTVDASNMSDPNAVSMGVSYMDVPTDQKWKTAKKAKLDNTKQAKNY